MNRQDATGLILPAHPLKAEARQFGALAHVSAVTDDFAVVMVFQPAKHHGCVESPRVRQNDFVDLLIHLVSLFGLRS